jgi:hypothetical protein
VKSLQHQNACQMQCSIAASVRGVDQAFSSWLGMHRHARNSSPCRYCDVATIIDGLALMPPLDLDTIFVYSLMSKTRASALDSFIPRTPASIPDHTISGSVLYKT